MDANPIRSGLLEIGAFGGQQPELDQVDLDEFWGRLAQSRYQQELWSQIIAKGILMALDVIFPK